MAVTGSVLATGFKTAISSFVKCRANPLMKALRTTGKITGPWGHRNSAPLHPNVFECVGFSRASSSPTVQYAFEDDEVWR